MTLGLLVSMLSIVTQLEVHWLFDCFSVIVHIVMFYIVCYLMNTEIYVCLHNLIIAVYQCRGL